MGHKKREFIKKKDRKVEEHSRIAPIEKLIPLTNLMKLWLKKKYIY